jgi:hypothetical protein
MPLRWAEVERECVECWLTQSRVALIVQIHLQQNRTDLAAKEAQRARRWAQDSLLVNIAESWVGMREVCPSPPPSSLNVVLTPSSGRREIPIRILRLRGISHNCPIAIPTLARRAGRIRTPPRPPPRSRSRAPTSHFHRRQLGRHNRESHRTEHTARQEGRKPETEVSTRVCAQRTQGCGGLGREETGVCQGSEQVHSPV